MTTRHEESSGAARAVVLASLVVSSALALAGACYRPDHLECALRCGPALLCPQGTSCGSDDYCHEDGVTSSCAAGAGGAGGSGGSDGGPDAAAPGDAAAADVAPPADAAGPRGLVLQTIAAGRRHSCGLTERGTLYCWGDGRSGALGGGTPEEPTASPRPLAGEWRAVAVGGGHTCAIASNGSLWCWGDNRANQLGLNDGTPQVSIPSKAMGPPTAWTALTAGEAHTCGLNDGQLWCWGDNGFGQSGAGAATTVPLPARVGDTADFTAVVAGMQHTCALRGPALYCWGDHGSGRLGAGMVAQPVRAIPFAPVGPGPRWRAVAAGVASTCALSDEGLRYCWGANDVQQLGCDAQAACSTMSQVWTPLRADDRSDWEEIAVGRGHGCGRHGGVIECWGDHTYGQTGRPFGTGFVEKRAPLVAPGLTWAALSAGGDHTCARTGDRGAWCWGSASHGQLGEGTIADSLVPAPIAGDHDWAAVSAGWLRHACAVTKAGELFCWGAGRDGQLGTGGLDDHYEPVRVDPGRVWNTVDAGLDFACGLSGQAVYCWGSNLGGEAGGPGLRPTPQRIDDRGGDNWIALSVGARHACGIRDAEGHRIWCWGHNDGYAAGGTDPQRLPGPVDVNRDWGTVVAGSSHTCALRGSALWCWGGGAPEPVRIGALNGFVQVAVGGRQTCVLDGAGVLWCGSNVNDAVQPVTAPKALPGTWASVSGGQNHICAVSLPSGKLKCWGDNAYGQLGTGDTVGANAPADVKSEEVFLDVSPGEVFTCGRTAAGARCWGLGHRGQLGAGAGSRPLPRPVETPK